MKKESGNLFKILSLQVTNLNYFEASLNFCLLFVKWYLLFSPDSDSFIFLNIFALDLTRTTTSTGTSPPKTNGTSPSWKTITSTSTGTDHHITEVGENRRISDGGKVVGLQRSKETVFLDLRPKEEEEEEVGSMFK